MLVKDKKHFATGMFMAISFFALFAVIMTPIFGGKNGLEFADDIFNKLSKGSAYFVPKVAKNVEKVNGKMVSVDLKMGKPDDKAGDGEKRAELAAKLFTAVEGTKVEVNGAQLKVEGDLGKILQSAVSDSDAMYHNEGAKIKAKYGVEDELRMFRQWHNALGLVDKSLTFAGQFDAAKIVNEVKGKLIETSYNYYKIEPQKVQDRLGVMTGLLLFYVIYTMWWGYALYHLFEGVGLTTKKAKIKKEV